MWTCPAKVESHPLWRIEEVAMSRNKQRRFTDEFKREAVRLIETSGRSVQRVAHDLGIAKSTLSLGGPAAVTSQKKNIRTMAVASRGTRVSAGGYLLTKRRKASRVTFAADNAELSERRIGCRRMQARVHFSKASRSAP
jgi:transposase-like protein